ncbi:EcsC family protein [Perlucidibaca piscinae]|uniref:EcsC family protein n=1 Tax=Perlucidibaca piscinae TaxID=392589 RepID=UPI0003B722A5|nr:EcsC family protein [Perlucidibaca piscinae]
MFFQGVDGLGYFIRLSALYRQSCFLYRITAVEFKLDKGASVSKGLTEGAIMRALDFAYDKAVNGVAGMDSASEIAESYMKVEGSKIDQANSLIRWQNTKAGTSGFLTGLGGIIVMPVTIPANIASVMYVQIRMIAAIAHLGGHDLKDDRVKALVYTCLTGNAAKDIMKDIGIVVGRKLTENAIKNVSGKTITAINQKVGFRLLTKFGEKGAVNLGKAIPLVGGIVGATFDSVTTNIIGNIARDTFISSK